MNVEPESLVIQMHSVGPGGRWPQSTEKWPPHSPEACQSVMWESEVISEALGGVGACALQSLDEAEDLEAAAVLGEGGVGMDTGVFGQCILQRLGGRGVHLLGGLERRLEVAPPALGLDRRRTRVDQIAPATVGSMVALRCTPCWSSAVASAKTVLGSVSTTIASTPALFIPSATGATLVLPNGKLSFR